MTRRKRPLRRAKKALRRERMYFEEIKNGLLVLAHQSDRYEVEEAVGLVQGAIVPHPGDEPLEYTFRATPGPDRAKNPEKFYGWTRAPDRDVYYMIGVEVRVAPRPDEPILPGWRARQLAACYADADARLTTAGIQHTMTDSTGWCDDTTSSGISLYMPGLTTADAERRFLDLRIDKLWVRFSGGAQGRFIARVWDGAEYRFRGGPVTTPLWTYRAIGGRATRPDSYVRTRYLALSAAPSAWTADPSLVPHEAEVYARRPGEGDLPIGHIRKARDIPDSPGQRVLPDVPESPPPSPPGMWSYHHYSTGQESEPASYQAARELALAASPNANMGHAGLVYMGAIGVYSGTVLGECRNVGYVWRCWP